jgi:hypothetical protein
MKYTTGLYLASLARPWTQIALFFGRSAARGVSLPGSIVGPWHHFGSPSSSCTVLPSHNGCRGREGLQVRGTKVIDVVLALMFGDLAWNLARHYIEPIL